MKLKNWLIHCWTKTLLETTLTLLMNWVKLCDMLLRYIDVVLWCSTLCTSSIKRSILGQSIRSRSIRNRNSFQDRRSCWLFEWFHGSNIRVRFEAQILSTIMCSTLCVVHVLYILYPINSNHFSFCLLFNEEYEINYDSRVTVLDQIMLVFIPMLIFVLANMNQ